MRNFSVKRFGLNVGDSVQSTAEYERLFNNSFYAIILFFKDDVAIIEKDNGERDAVKAYWLQKIEKDC